MKQITTQWLIDEELPEELELARVFLNNLHDKHSERGRVRLVSDGTIEVYLDRLETDEEEAERESKEAERAAMRLEREASLAEAKKRALRDAIAKLQTQLAAMEGETPCDSTPLRS